METGATVDVPTQTIFLSSLSAELLNIIFKQVLGYPSIYHLLSSKDLAVNSISP